MMTRQAFLAAFDVDRWLAGPEVLDRLDQRGFWDAWWQKASHAAKLVYLAHVCWRCRDEHGLPCILAMDRGEGTTRTFMYKPCAALTPDEYLEAHRYFSELARYERRAAEIAEALAWRFEGNATVPHVDADRKRRRSVQQFGMQKQAEARAVAQSQSFEDILRGLEEEIDRILKP